MKTAIIVLAAAVALAGCYGSPQTQERVTPDFKVARLFTYDGCTVYRFWDGGMKHFTRCVEGQSSASWSENCGKNCTRQVQVDATTRKEGQ